LSRIRSIEPSAELLDPAGYDVVADVSLAATDRAPLRPTLILGFGGLSLCCAPDADGTDWWWTGCLDGAGKSITCWSPCSDDLATAIRAL
jgi:hypothetical protein